MFEHPASICKVMDSTPVGSTEYCIREFKQITTAGAAIVVEEVSGEYLAVARQNSTLRNAKYKYYSCEVLKL